MYTGIPYYYLSVHMPSWPSATQYAAEAEYQQTFMYIIGILCA